MSRKTVLKHYTSYLERLHAFSAAMGVKVISDEDVDGEGIWLPTRNTIKIDQNMTQTDEIATFLHELGHMLDDIKSLPAKEMAKLDKAYKSFYASKAKKTQITLVYECEKKAWNNARNIAKKLKIRLGKWYYHAEVESLKGYRSHIE